MSTRTLPPTIALHRGAGAALFDRLLEAARQLRAAWAERHARRLAEDVEHELMRLDPRTLQDIGAPEGLLGQRRWQEEERHARSAERLLDLRGW